MGNKRPTVTYPRPCTRCGIVKDADGFHVKYKATETRKEYRFAVCKDCHNAETRASLAQKRAEDPETARAKQRARYHAKIDTYRETGRRWYRENAERARELQRAWRARNRERSREWERGHRQKYRARKQAQRKQRAEYFRQLGERWRKANANRIKAVNHEYYEAHKAQFKAHVALRRARVRGAEGMWTPDEWEALKREHGYRCLKCGRTEPDIKLTPDHVVPLARGGPNTIDNIQPLCLSCNCSKNVRIADYRPHRSRPRPKQLPLW